jgi:hypothetical protein
MAQGTTKGIPIDTDASFTANSDLLVPSQKAVKTYVANNSLGGVTIDTDTTLSANSDTRIATQKATKAYTDSKFATRYARRHDYTGVYSYCGTAAFGSADSAAAWYITRIPINANGTVGVVQRSPINSIWNNRASLTYT